MQPRLGIYIHIPFCASKCGYCDFYSCAGAAERMAEYQQALLEHIEESAGRIAPAYIDTVYFGGGTPSFYGAARLIELLDAVKATGRLLKRAEVTVEVNPDSVRLHDLRALRKAGFNRLSIGMQSANNDILKMIGRRHSYRQVEMAVETPAPPGLTTSASTSSTVFPARPAATGQTRSPRRLPCVRSTSPATGSSSRRARPCTP